VIKIIAVLCGLSSPARPDRATSDFADVSMQFCLMGASQLAGSSIRPNVFAAWRCVIGKQGGRGAQGRK